MRRWFLLPEALWRADILHACQGRVSGPRSRAGKVNAQAWQPWGNSSCEMKRPGSSHLEGAVKLDLFGCPGVDQVLKPLPQYIPVLKDSTFPAQGTSRSKLDKVRLKVVQADLVGLFYLTTFACHLFFDH